MSMNDKHRVFDFAGLLVDTAQRKHAAALARGSGVGASEPPRAVFQEACAQIAASLAPLGFRYVKSGSRAIRKADGVLQRIQFQSDRNNVAGVHVRLVIGAGAESPALEKWLAGSAWPFKANPVLGGGQIGNLIRPHGWWEWQLADPATRSAQIADAEHQIRQIALPFLQRFDDLDRLAALLRSQRISGIDAVCATAIAYWRLGADAAGEVASLWLREWGDASLVQFRAERDRLLHGGAPQNIYGNGAERLGAIAAALKVMLDF